MWAERSKRVAISKPLWTCGYLRDIYESGGTRSQKRAEGLIYLATDEPTDIYHPHNVYTNVILRQPSAPVHQLEFILLISRSEKTFLDQDYESS